MTRKTFTQRMEVTGSELVDKVKEIAKDSNARRVVVKDRSGKELVTIPLGWGAAAGAVALLAAPWLAVLAAVGGAFAKVTLEVERTDGTGDPDASGPSAGPEAAGDDLPVIPTDAPTWDVPPSDRG